MSHCEHLSQAERLESETAVLEQWLKEVLSLTRECQECQEELSTHWQFCSSCDMRLAVHCPGCSNAIPPAGAYACPGCGLVMPRLEL